MITTGSKRIGVILLATIISFGMIFSEGMLLKNKAEAAQKQTYTVAYPTAFILHAKEKKNKNSKTVSIPYKAKVKVYGKITKRSKSEWVKLKYNGKICYKYFKKNTIYFTKKPIRYSDYENLDVNKIRQEVVTKAINTYRYNKTVYKNTKDIVPGSKDSKGRMRFDCSGFTSYVINGVMKKYVPNYEISKGISAQYNAKWLYTDANGEFNVSYPSLKNLGFLLHRQQLAKHLRITDVMSCES